MSSSYRVLSNVLPYRCFSPKPQKALVTCAFATRLVVLSHLHNCIVKEKKKKKDKLESYSLLSRAATEGSSSG